MEHLNDYKHYYADHHPSQPLIELDSSSDSSDDDDSDSLDDFDDEILVNFKDFQEEYLSDSNK